MGQKCSKKESIHYEIFGPHVDIDCFVINDLKENTIKTCRCSGNQLCLKCPYSGQKCLGCGLCDWD